MYSKIKKIIINKFFQIIVIGFKNIFDKIVFLKKHILVICNVKYHIDQLYFAYKKYSLNGDELYE